MKKLLLLGAFVLSIFSLYAQPTVTAVAYQTPAAGSYGVGQLITIRVTFSTSVDVTVGGGGPRIQLNITPTTRYAVASAVSNSTTVDFNYNIVAGDIANPLDYASTGALTLQSGTITQNGVGTPATLTLPAVGTLPQDRIVDAAGPTINSIVRQNPSTNPTNADAVNWDVTFSETVTGVDATDFTITGTTGTIGTVNNVGGNTYRVPVSGGNLASLNATITLGFAGGQNIKDALNNALTNTTPTGTNNATYDIDNTAPRISSIVRQNPSTSPTNADVLVWDVQFNEAVINVGTADFSVSGTTGTITGAVDQGSNLFRITASGGDLASVNGTVTLSMAGGQDIADVATNALTNTTPLGTNNNTFNLDNTAPRISSIVRQNPTTSPTNADVLVWDVQFNEPVINVGTADFAVAGTTATVASAVDQGGNLFRVTVSGGDLASLNATVTLSMAGGQDIADAVGNALTNTTPLGTNNNTFVVDNTAPRIANITRQNPTTTPTNADALVWDVEFDEVVLNVSNADFSVAGTTATVASVVDQGSNIYRVTVSGGNLASLNATVTLSMAGGQDITDAAGIALSNTTPTGTNNNTFVVDNTAPRISSIVRQNPATSPTNADVLVWDVQFNEAVLNVSVGDFNVTGTTATVTGVVDQGGNLYRVTVSGGDLAALNATVTLSIAGGQNITDAATNAFSNFTPLGTNNDTFVVDNTNPRISSIVRQNPATSPTNADVLVWDVQFNEPVLNVGTADFAVAGTTATVASAIDQGGNLFRVTVSGGNLASLNATVTLSMAGGQDITDASTNPLTNTVPLGTNNDNFVVDNTAPVITATSNAFPAAPPLIIGNTIIFTVTPTVPETGLTIAPTVAGYNGGNLAWSTLDGGITYTATYTVASGQTDRPAPIQLTGVTATDQAGNTSSTVATADVVKPIDANRPTLVITRNPVTLGSLALGTTDNSVSFNLAFNELMNNGTFTIADIAINITGTVANTAPVAGDLTTSDNQNYTFTINGITGDGTLGITVGPTIADAAGNNMLAAQVSPTFLIDNTAPATPTTPDLVAASDAGQFNNDNITNVMSPQFSVGSTEVNATVRIFSNVDAGVRGSAVAAGATTTVNTTLVTQGNGQLHNITAIQTDAAGNPSLASSALSITLDATPPVVNSSDFKTSNSNGTAQLHFFNCNGTMTDTDSNTEMVHLFMSEDLGLAEGTIVSGFSVSAGTLDLTCETGSNKRGASVYHKAGIATNTALNPDAPDPAIPAFTIHLKSANNNDWGSAPTITYTPGGNIKDVAGNEFGAAVPPPVDTDPPIVVSGMVLDLNGSLPERIIFQIDQTLNATAVGSGFVVGFSTSVGTIATQAYNPGTNTITLTSTANGMWNDLVTVSYTQQPANPNRVSDPNGNEMVAFSGPTAEPILLQNIGIVSNNGVNTAFAKVGDVVTVSFTVATGHTLILTPTVTINGNAATVNTGAAPLYTATFTTLAGTTPEGPMTISIVADETGRTTTTTYITNGSQVNFDKTQPTVVLNDDHPDNIVRDADNVVISAVFTEANGLSSTPTISIAGLTVPVSNVPMTATGNPLIWTYNWNVPAGDDGNHAVTISAFDAAGNANTAATAGTGPTTYLIDNTAPTVVLNDTHPDNIVRDADANITITAAITEINGIAGTPTITIGSVVTNAPMSGGPLNWTYVWDIPAGNDGTHAVTITGTDVAGNPIALPTAGTGPTAYIIDNTAPTVVLNDDHPDNIVRDADNVTITAVFTEAVGLTGTPTITIAGVGVTNVNMTATANPLQWTYLWNVPAGNDGSHAVSISVFDIAGNANTAATAGTGPTSYLIDNISPSVVLDDDHPDAIVRDADIVNISAVFTEINGIAPTPTITIAGLSPTVINAPMTATANPLIFTYAWDVPAGVVNDGSHTITITATDVAGNPNTAATAGTGQLSYTIDNTPPTVTSIAITTPVLGFGTNGITATSADFQITYSETIATSVLASDIQVVTGNDVSLVDPFPGITFTPLINGNITGAGTTRTVTVPGLAGTGWLRINFIDNDNVTDIAGNPIAGAANGTFTTSFTFPGTESYTRVLQQPSNPITAPTITQGAGSFTVGWTDAVAPAVQATHYLVMIKKTTVGAFPAVNDGTYVPDDSDLTDNILKQNITFGTTSATFTGLPVTDNYDFIIYPYTLSANNQNSNINFGTPVTVSSLSDIVQNFNYGGVNDNILYKNYQATDILNSGTSIILEEFQLRDGGASSPDADVLPTILNSITLDVTNWQNLRRLALYDGATELQELAVTNGVTIFPQSATVGRITFNTFAFQANDDNTKQLSIRASFLANGVTDNQRVTFAIVSVGTAASNSSQLLTKSPTGPTVASDATGVQNQIEVVAIQLDFTTPAIATSASISVNFPLVIEARDGVGFDNRDLDWTGASSAVNTFTNAAGDPMINAPIAGSQFTAGMMSFATFQYSNGSNGDNVTLTMKAGGSGACNGTTILCGTSPAITLTTSSESVLVYNSLFTYQPRIPYLNLQNINAAGTSHPLASFRLFDGDGTNNDSDGAPTNMTSITFAVSTIVNGVGAPVPGSTDINQLALYDNAGVLIASTVTTLGGASTVTFSGLTIATPSDFSSTTFTLRASFKNTAANVLDKDIIQVVVTDIVQSGGSRFNITGGVLGGNLAGTTVTGAVITPNNVNQVDVVATRLDFTTQPNIYQGINQPINYPSAVLPSIVVEARDANQIVDLEHTFGATISSGGATLSTSSFVFGNNVTLGPGKLDLSTIQYTTTGIGTLTVVSNGISSDSGVSPGAISCNVINVIHVDVAGANSPASNVTQSPTLIGSSTGNIIFGATFTAFNAVAANGGQPQIKEFTIRFGNPITNVVLNPTLWESTNAVYAPSDLKIPASEYTVTPGPDYVTFTFNAGFERKLNTYIGNRVTFFLQIDIDNSVTAATGSITPTLSKLIYSGGDIVLSNGSSFADISNPIPPTNNTHTYAFLDIVAPYLVTSNPANGAVNQPLNGTVNLTFNETVTSKDNQIRLYNYTKNSFVAILPITGPSTGTTLSFTTPTLKADTLYFIKVAAGDFNNNKGIFDQSNNAFPGITSKSVLAFRASSGIAPSITDNTSYVPITSQTGTLQIAIDRPGVVHYMIARNSLYPGVAPTPAQIDAFGSYPGGILSGTLNVTQAGVYFFANISSPSFLASTGYDVWTYAYNTDQPTPVASPVLPVIFGNSGPERFTFNTPAAGTGLVLAQANYNVCTGGFQVVLPSITIAERANGDLNGKSGTFFLVLPSGFLFNTAAGTVSQLGGSDAGAASLTYVNNTILAVTFANSGSSSLDRIVISGLQVESTSTSASGNILKKFGGALTADFPDDTSFGLLTTTQLSPATFTNSLSSNFISNETQAVGLNPINPGSDFGPNVFSGPGVNGDSLFVQTLGLGNVDITLTHTYQNGCVTTFTDTYIIYDRATAIPNLGGKYCTDTFNQPTAVSIPFDARQPQFYLQSLKVALPQEILDGTRTQILSIADTALVRSSLSKSGPAIPGNSPGLPFSSTVFLQSYTFDPRVFDRPAFYSQFPLNDGGSIGDIEFTAVYLDATKAGKPTTIKLRVTIYIPPRARFRIQEAGPITPEFFCENFGNLNINLNGQPSPLPNVSTGIFQINALGSYPGLTDNGNGSAVINTQAVNAATNPLPQYSALPITYTYTSIESGCVSVASKPFIGASPTISASDIRIEPNPAAVVSLASANTANTPTPTSYCESVPVQFNASGSTISNGPTSSIALYQWDFADATNQTGQNPSTVAGPGGGAAVAGVPAAGTNDKPNHTYIQAAAYDIVTRVVSAKGCVSQPVTTSIKVGSIPVVNFKYSGESGLSATDPIRLQNTSSIASASIPVLNDGFNTLDWDFGDASNQNGISFGSQAQYLTTIFTKNYSSPNPYSIKLTVTSKRGCVNTKSQTVVTLPRYVSSAASQYVDNFENAAKANDWQTWPQRTDPSNPSSWLYNAPDKTVIKKDAAINGTRIWATSSVADPNTYSKDEKSALYTPSIDTRLLARPMISMSTFVQMNPNQNDGVVVQYSTDTLNVADPAKVWTVLGNLTSGVDWYTNQGIASKPGNQAVNDFGWAGNSKTFWQDSRHALVDLSGPTPTVVKSKHMVFRFALAAGSTPNEGFAIDNFRIGERTRTILLESFTSVSNADPAEKAENDAIAAFNSASVGLEVVKLNYHMNFPRNDPFNTDNPADPSSRALFYGVSKTPTSRLDGDYDKALGKDAPFSTWGATQFSTRSLQLAQADVVIRPSGTSITANGKVEIYVDVTPNVQNGLDDKTVLHIGVMEQRVTKTSLTTDDQDLILSGETTFEYVVKKLIPDASGTKTKTHPNASSGKLLNGVTYTFGPIPWIPIASNFYAPNTGDLSIAVFLQNEETKEVYQSEIVSNLDDPDPTLITGLEPLAADQVVVYPNPANHEMTVQLPGKVGQPAALQMIDQTGRTTLMSSIPEGSDRKTLNVRELSSGMYILTIDMGQGVLTRKKVIVVHQE